MANWSSNLVIITGPGLEVIANKVNSLLVPSDDELALEFKSWGVEKDWILIREPLKVKNGKIRFFGANKWYPPISGLEKISAEFPAIVMTVRYDVEFLWDAGEWHIQGGESKMTKHYRGYFESADEGQPVHHWLVQCKDDAILAAIKDAGLTTVGEEHKSEVTVRDGDALETLLDTRFPDADVYAMPYTLDESAYIGSLQTLKDEGRRGPLGPHFQELMKVAERKIALAPTEVAVIRDRLLENAVQWQEWNLICPVNIIEDEELVKSGEREERLYKRPPFVCQIERDRVRRYYGDIALGESGEYYPTAREIKWILPHCANENRRKALENALAAPAWTTQWPMWDILEEKRQVEEAKRREEDKLLIIPKDLLEKLVLDPADFEKRLHEERSKEILRAFQI